MLFVQHHSPAPGPGQRLLLGAEGAWATRPLPPAVPCVWVGGRGLHPGRGKGGPRCPPPPTLPGYAHLCLLSPRPAGAEAADAGEAEHRQLSPGHYSAHQAAGPQVPAGLQRAERNRESTPPLAAQAAESQPGRCPGAGQARTGSPTPCPAPSPLRAALEGLWGSPGCWSTDAQPRAASDSVLGRQTSPRSFSARHRGGRRASRGRCQTAPDLRLVPRPAFFSLTAGIWPV